MRPYIKFKFLRHKCASRCKRMRTLWRLLDNAIPHFLCVCARLFPYLHLNCDVPTFWSFAYVKKRFISPPSPPLPQIVQLILRKSFTSHLSASICVSRGKWRRWPCCNALDAIASFSGDVVPSNKSYPPPERCGEALRPADECQSARRREQPNVSRGKRLSVVNLNGCRQCC